jgi:uncharacterized protein (UPF0248 family)
MDPNRTFSKEEISKILALASKIQNQKDLNQDEMALSVEDLRHIAAEVGIDRESLNQAIDTASSADSDATFRWFRQSSTILDDLTLTGELTEEAWEDVVQEIRRITGYIGKPGKVGKAFEWEQPESDTGVEKHLSLSPKNGKTRIRYIAKWYAVEVIAVGSSMLFGAGLGILLFELLQLSGASFLILPFLGVLSGFGLSRLIMKRYFEKQKSQYAQIVAAIKKRLRSSGAQKVLLDEIEMGHEGERSHSRSGDSTPLLRIAQENGFEN